MIKLLKGSSVHPDEDSEASHPEESLEHWARRLGRGGEALAQMEQNHGHYHCVLRGEE